MACAGTGHEGSLKSPHTGTRYDLFPVGNWSGQLPIEGRGSELAVSLFSYRRSISQHCLMVSEKAPGFLFYFPNEGVEVLSPISEAPGLTCLIKHIACLINAGQRTVASQGRGRTEPDGSHRQGEEAADPQQLSSLGPEPQVLEKLAH